MNRERESGGDNRARHRFVQLTTVCTFLLLIAGGLVTSNEAGLAVPDWPLSYGTWLPPMVGNIVYEHGHRMVAAFVGLLTVILAAWLWLREPRRWVRRLGGAALAAVITQGLLGGLTVLFLLPRPVSIAHASLAQMFFCLMVSLAVVTGPGWRPDHPKTEDTSKPTLVDLAAVTTLAIFVQLILGAAYRHSALGIIPHLVGAAVVAVLVVRSVSRVWQCRARPAQLRRSAWLLGVLLALQLFLGLGAYVTRLAAADASQPPTDMVVLTVAHLAAGGLLLATSVALTLYAHRLLVRPGQALSLAAAGEEAAA
jgi:cytochrome c oxidase assembly protein subunit 15